MTTDHSNTARLEAFSDGVFAIAITLLVFNLKVPELPKPTEVTLRAALWQQWPAYAGFLSSFLTILIIWLNHHYLLKYIRRADRPFMFANGFLLLIVTFIPFPTSLLSAYILTPAAGTGAFVFATTYLLLALAFNLLWYVAQRRGILHPDTHRQVNFKGVRRGYLTGPLCYGAAVGLAPFWPIGSVVICVAMAVFFAVLSYEA
jgi:uncharacterized membrane protein